MFYSQVTATKSSLTSAADWLVSIQLHWPLNSNQTLNPPPLRFTLCAILRLSVSLL